MSSKGKSTRRNRTALRSNLFATAETDPLSVASPVTDRSGDLMSFLTGAADSSATTTTTTTMTTTTEPDEPASPGTVADDLATFIEAPAPAPPTKCARCTDLEGICDGLDHEFIKMDATIRELSAERDELLDERDDMRKRIVDERQRYVAKIDAGEIELAEALGNTRDAVGKLEAAEQKLNELDEMAREVILGERKKIAHLEEKNAVLKAKLESLDHSARHAIQELRDENALLRSRLPERLPERSRSFRRRTSGVPERSPERSRDPRYRYTSVVTEDRTPDLVAEFEADADVLVAEPMPQPVISTIPYSADTESDTESDSSVDDSRPVSMSDRISLWNTTAKKGGAPATRAKPVKTVKTVTAAKATKTSKARAWPTVDASRGPVNGGAEPKPTTTTTTTAVASSDGETDRKAWSTLHASRDAVGKARVHRPVSKSRRAPATVSVTAPVIVTAPAPAPAPAPVPVPTTVSAAMPVAAAKPATTDRTVYVRANAPRW
jgi:hypothetical protein